jgi:hypothetical protein
MSENFSATLPGIVERIISLYPRTTRRKPKSLSKGQITYIERSGLRTH